MTNIIISLVLFIVGLTVACFTKANDMVSIAIVITILPVIEEVMVRLTHVKNKSVAVCFISLYVVALYFIASNINTGFYNFIINILSNTTPFYKIYWINAITTMTLSFSILTFSKKNNNVLEYIKLNIYIKYVFYVVMTKDVNNILYITVLAIVMLLIITCINKKVNKKINKNINN